MSDQNKPFNPSDAVQKAKDAVAGDPERAQSAIDKVENFLNEQTGGKYSEQIGKAGDFIENQLGLGKSTDATDGAAGESDTTTPATGPAADSSAGAGSGEQPGSGGFDRGEGADAQGSTTPSSGQSAPTPPIGGANADDRPAPELGQDQFGQGSDAQGGANDPLSQGGGAQGGSDDQFGQGGAAQGGASDQFGQGSDAQGGANDPLSQDDGDRDPLSQSDGDSDPLSEPGHGN